MSRCPDQVVSQKRYPQCSSPQASLVLIHRPTAGGMKGQVDLAQPEDGTSNLWCGRACDVPYLHLKVIPRILSHPAPNIGVPRL
ncbi:hypothetical protein TNCV_519001 [Trichonephila clavipes]|nr:hypothetical protein TNCV_519001 [Trichonephila clavipes]